MKTPGQTDSMASVYVSNGSGANRLLELPYRAPVTSTNTVCMDTLRQMHADGWTALWTDDQTAGRGRAGRTWVSCPGDSLCLSVGRHLAAGQLPNPALTVALGAAVAGWLQTVGCAGINLKWPNDLLLQGRKLGGILCEAASLPGSGGTCLVAGVGLNLKPMALGITALSHQAGAATPLPPASLDEAGVDLGAAQLATGLAQVVVDVLSCACDALQLAQWCQLADRMDAWKGREVNLHDQGQIITSGLAAGIGSDGRYRLDTPTGPQYLAIGEMSLRSAE